MTRTKSLFAAAAIIISAAAMTVQTKPAEALPRIQLSAPVVEAGVVTKIGYKRRIVRRIWRNHVRHGHWHGYRRGFYGAPYAGGKCHRHFHKAPGMHLHARVRCGHWHFRAYGTWK